MRRLQAMIMKELWAVLRDPRSRLVLFVPPLLQLFVFTFATTLDVKYESRTRHDEWLGRLGRPTLRLDSAAGVDSLVADVTGWLDAGMPG